MKNSQDKHAPNVCLLSTRKNAESKEQQHEKPSANTPRECLKNSAVDVITKDGIIVSAECLHALRCVPPRASSVDGRGLKI